MRAAHVLGMGLDCALGADPETRVAALRTPAMPVGRIRLEALADPVDAACYRIDDGAEPLDPERPRRLIPPVVAAALAAAGLSAAQRRHMPILVGSSCFAIARDEALYARALQARDGDAVAMPEARFDSIGQLAADAAGSQGRILSWHTACTSAANALLAGQRMIAAGHCEHALVLGVEWVNCTSLAGFSALQLLSDSVRPFDAERRGLVLGEAVGAIVLGAGAGHSGLRLRGGAANCDTHGVTSPGPDGATIAAVQQQALAHAGCQPGDIRAIKAHATGTAANDACEARALHRVFASLPPVCALKSRIGHTLGACGVSELALFGEALQAGFLPITPGFASADPKLGVTPLQQPRAAPSGTYLLNQFGFGGSNTSLVLELG